MDTYWYNKLLDLLKVQSNSENEKLMVLYLDKELRELKLPYQIDAAGNIIVTKGKATLYPCVVSHMDTVHNFVPDFKIYIDIDDNDIHFAMSNKQRVGIGGDDKCGIFACLYLLKTIPQIKVVFFSREESGCRGSGSINMKFFADCMYLIQLDRRGKRDFIQTYWSRKTISHEFSSEIGLIKKKYKYKNQTGTVTDVMKLWDNRIGISCINLSCGYYRPHSEYEYISIHDLWHSVMFTEEIIKTLQPKKYTSLPPAHTVVNATLTTGAYKSTYSQCCKCKKWKKEALLYEVKGNKAGELMCWPCKKAGLDKKKGKDKINSGTETTSPSVDYIKCNRCNTWAAENLMHKWPDGWMCWRCNIDLKKELDKQCINHSELPNGDVIPFACHECGKTVVEMDKGDSLRYYVGDSDHLYCNSCAETLFGTPDATNLPERCFVCDKVIPKDHKIIKRFGVLICEDCATDEELSR